MNGRFAGSVLIETASAYTKQDACRPKEPQKLVPWRLIAADHACVPLETGLIGAAPDCV